MQPPVLIKKRDVRKEERIERRKDRVDEGRIRGADSKTEGRKGAEGL